MAVSAALFSLIYITRIRTSSYQYQHMQKIHIFPVFLFRILTQRFKYDTKKKKGKLFECKICLKLNKRFHFSVGSFMLHRAQGCYGSALNL